MKKTVTPKKAFKGNAQFYGEAFGMTAVVILVPGQIWNAESRKGYWILRKNGSEIELRLTEAAADRMFEEVRQA